MCGSRDDFASFRSVRSVRDVEGRLRPVILAAETFLRSKNRKEKKKSTERRDRDLSIAPDRGFAGTPRISADVEISFRVPEKIHVGVGRNIAAGDR